MNEDFVEVIDIWEVEKSGEFRVAKKLVARFVNGTCLKIADNYATEITPITKTEADNLIKTND